MSSTVEKQSEVLYTITKTRTYNFNKVEITAENVSLGELKKESDNLDIYVKKEYDKLVAFANANQSKVQTSTASSGSNKTFTIKEPNAPASEKQINALLKAGYTQAELAGYTKQQASDAIDASKQKSKNKKIANTASEPNNPFG